MTLRKELEEGARTVGQIVLASALLSVGAIAVAYFWTGRPVNAIDYKSIIISSFLLSNILLAIDWFVREHLWIRLRSMPWAKRLAYARAIAAVTSIAPLFQSDAAFNSPLSVFALIVCAVAWATVMAVGYEITYLRHGQLWFPLIVILAMLGLFAVVNITWHQGMSLATVPMNTLTERQKLIIPLLLGVPLVILGLTSWRLLRGKVLVDRPIGIVTRSERNGYPMLAWSQLAGSSETQAGADARGRLGLYLVFVGIFAVAGFLSGSIEGMVLSTLLGGWLGIFGLRESGTLALQGDTLRHVPHTKSAEERREEAAPVVHREDCRAYVEVEKGELYFCLNRGNLDDGPLPPVERVPLDSFGNFEEGSHREWFRSKLSSGEVKDWGVIIAQSNTGRVLRVAESIGERLWLVELLILLQRTFVEDRPLLQMRLDSIQRDESRPPSNSPAIDQVDQPATSPSPSSVPKRKF